MSMKTKPQQESWELDILELMEEAHGCGFNYSVNCKWLGHNKKAVEFVHSLLQKERQGIREEVEKMGPDIVIPGLLETYIIKNKVLQLLEDKDV